MSNNYQLFLEAYASAKQPIKDLIDSNQIGLFAESIMSDTSNSKQKRQLIVAISNRILNISTNSIFVSKLEKADITIRNIGRAMTFLEEKMTPAITNSTSATVPNTNTTVTWDTAKEIETVENDLQKISTLRTMDSDGRININKETSGIPAPVYSSTQSAILREGK